MLFRSSNGKATVTPAGGNGEYTYAWDNGETTSQAVGLNSGLHTVTVTDKLGYTTTCNVMINQPEQALSCSIIQDKAVTANGLSNGEATVTPIGGNGNYTYAWDNGETSAKAVSLNAGSHSVIVTDAKGCTTTCSITITQPDVLSCSVIQDDPAKCFGDSNGKATVTPAGGNGEYTYAWDNGEIAAQAVGLNSGLHTVTVTDKLGYTTTCNVMINQPEQALSCSIIQDKAVTANGLSNGEATVTPIGGNGNYTYAWDNGETSAKAILLSAGSHSVTVTDAKGCTSTCSITITQPDVLSCSITQDDPAKCYGDSNGKATVTPVGGNGEYTYTWDNGETASQAVGLNAGLHTVTVTDKLGYTTTCNVTINQPEQALSCSIIQDKAVTANGLSNGEATVTPIGGNGNYTYAWDNGETSAKAITLSAGSHSVTVTDAKGCTTTCSITITQPDVLSCSITQDDPAKCYGDSNGKATVTPVGGNGDYTYSWDNSEITAQAVGLNSGLHTVTVTDKLGYTTTCNVMINQPEQALSCSIIQDKAVTANGLSNGEATVTPIGGNGNYTYAWDNGETSAKAILLSAGSHSVIVTDAKGCTSTCSVTITQPDILSCNVTQDDPAKCYGDSNGKATVTPVGGNGEYTYAWDNGEITSQAVGLNAGLHTVTVTDKLGYTTTCNVMINQPEQALSCSISQDKAVTANGLSNGEATVTPVGGNGNYTYAWDNGETFAKAIALSAGSHSVTVTDAKGCTTTCSITITQPDVLSCSVTQDDPAKCYGDSNGKATVTPVGGNGEYTYVWDNGEITAQAVGLNAGLHTVIVTDKLGYTTTCNVTISQPEQALSAVKSQIDVTCGGGNTASATVIVSGGTSPYSYAWNTNPVQTSATANTLLAGNYSVIITDAKGCTITESFIILDGDAVKPIIAPLPETTTINCPEVPVFTEATATDNNGTISSLTYEDTIATGNCAGSYTKTRTWTAVDACGNISLPVSQVIIVQDIIAPTWVTQIGSLNQTVECSNQEALASAQARFPIASDNCDSDVSNIEKVSGQFMASEGCSNTGTITNTWTAKDDCGNISGNFTQVITIQDKTAPVFTGNLPSDMTVSCDAVPQPAEMTASDNCNGDLPIVFTEIKSGIQEGCSSNYILTRKWTTSDCGSNTVSYTQIITVRDTTPPTGTAPADVANLQNIASIPVGSPSDIKDAADNCSANVNITVSDSNNGGSGCDGNAYILTRTYILTDCAGNKTELVQTITVDNKVSVSAVASNATCLGASDGFITVTNSAGSTVVITNANNQVVSNTNLPAGTYTVTATAAVNGENQTCSATTTVVITEPNYKVKISGIIINVDTNTPISGVPVTLIPQGSTSGPILLRITGADGAYSFTGMPVGSYLVQVQDANLNSAYQLYPINSSLFFTTLAECTFQTHNFEYGKSTLPVLGDYVWYDTNNNGIQDEWYDANNDGVVTKNIPDSNDAVDFSQWEWIDLNGDGSYKGAQNVGELNAGGFGNALSANVIVDGPNGYHADVIVGIEGFWRNRPGQPNPYGDYTIKLVRDANLDGVAAALGATGLVKVIPSIADKKATSKSGKTQMHTVCQTSSPSSYIVTVTPEDLVHLDADFGVNCKEVQDIAANDDTAGPIAGVNHTTTNVLNVLPNDTLEGVVVTSSDVIITTVTPNEFLHLNMDGSVDVLPNAPVGTLTMVYQICEADETTNCDTATVTVTIEAPVMTVTATAICVNDVPYVDYVVTPVNFTPVNGVTIAWENSSNTVITTMTDLPLSGRVLWPGAVVDQAGHGVDWPGWIFENNKWIQGADGFESLRPTVNLTISVNPSQTITLNYPPADPYCTSRPTFAIAANDDSAGPVNAINATIPNIINVYTNDTLNGSPVNPADVTLTTAVADPTGTLTLNPDGSIDVKANAPVGTYTLTYQICENADFGNCDTAIVMVIISAPTPVIANDDTYANIGCNTFGLVGNVLTNDLKGQLPATLLLVNFSLISETNNAKTDPNITIDASGNVTVSSLTPAGTYTYSYRICDKLNAENCDTAIVTITIAPLGVVNISGEACNDDASLLNLTNLLPENTPINGQWIDSSGSNALQGSILNPFGLALGNYIFEYKITDAACPRSILLTMALNDDCKVLACGNVIIHNAFSPNGDGINDVFKIDNIDEVTCYPGNTVEIYNRWGILVFETSNYNNATNAFDGTSRGRTTIKQSEGLPAGTYFYIINYKSLNGNNVIQNNKLDGYLYLSK